MVKAVGYPSLRPVQPDRPGDAQQIVGTEDVGLDECVGIVDGAVHMALGGEVDDDVEVMVGHDPLYQQGIIDVALYEAETTVLFQPFQIMTVAGVGEGVQGDERGAGMLLQPVVAEVGADEAGGSGHQQAFFDDGVSGNGHWAFLERVR